MRGNAFRTDAGEGDGRERGGRKDESLVLCFSNSFTFDVCSISQYVLRYILAICFIMICFSVKFSVLLQLHYLFHFFCHNFLSIIVLASKYAYSHPYPTFFITPFQPLHSQHGLGAWVRERGQGNFKLATNCDYIHLGQLTQAKVSVSVGS